MKILRDKFIWALILLLLAFPANLNARQKNISKEKSIKKEANYFLDSLLLTAGILSQYPLTHELGHYLGGRIAGVNLEFEESHIGGLNFKNNLSNQDKNIGASSGFIFPVIVSETMLDTHAPKDNPYIMGLILGPLIHNTSYIVQDLTGIKNDDYNDFETMDKAGIGREITYPIALIIPLVQVWRLTRNKKAKSRWNLWMGVSEHESVVDVSFRF